MLSLLYFELFRLWYHLKVFAIGAILCTIQTIYYMYKILFCKHDNGEIEKCKEENVWAIVTGGSGGIGKGFVDILLDLNYNVIVASRSCRDQSNHARKIHKKLDTSSLTSVKEFVDFVKEKNFDVRLIINNAGVLGPRSKTSEEGFDGTIATNYLGHALLTLLLLPHVKTDVPVKILNISSLAYIGADSKIILRPPDIYSPYLQYSRSKLYQLLFSFKLSRFVQEKYPNKNIISVAIEPGAVSTAIFRNTDWVSWFLITYPIIFKLKSAADTSRGIVREVLSINKPGQHYVTYKDKLGKAMSWTYDKVLQDRLWQLTVKKLGLNIN